MLSTILKKMDIQDFGPVYTESLHASGYPFEPYNTYSNVIFLLILLYWYSKLRGRFRKYPLFQLALPVLAVGFMGGTIFHATRSHSIWLIMDFVPIFFLTILAAFHFWLQLTGSKRKAFALTLAFFLLPAVIRALLPLSHTIRISIGYSSLALGIVAPGIILSYTQQWKAIGYIISSVACFAIAISFRIFDAKLAVYFPMGTHFLWHIFGGISTHLMLLFIWKHESTE